MVKAVDLLLSVPKNFGFVLKIRGSYPENSEFCNKNN